MVEGLLHHDRGELGAHAEGRPALLDRDQAVGLLDRGDDGLDVERADRAQVDHLGRDAVLGERVGRLERPLDHQAEGDDGDVGALAQHLRPADRQHEVLELRHLEGLAVEDLVFEEHDRIGIADRGLEQALGIGRRVGRDHLEARAVAVPGAVFLAVLGADPGGGAIRPAEHDRAAELAAGHVEGLGRRVDDVVDRLHGEVPGHELDDRPQAREGGADAQAREAVLGDRRVDHPADAELVEQPLAHLVGALILGDLLADQEHLGIAPHLLGHRVAQRLAHGLPDHGGAGRDLGLGLDRRGRRRGAIAPAADARWRRSRPGGRCRCRGRRLIERGPVLAFGEQEGDRRVDRDPLRAFRDQDATEDAVVDRLDLHGRLVGLDLGQHVAGGHGVALALQPLGEVALGHGRRQRGHQDLGRHVFWFPGANGPERRQPFR